jgi:hypothetical protein
VVLLRLGVYLPPHGAGVSARKDRLILDVLMFFFVKTVPRVLVD